MHNGNIRRNRLISIINIVIAYSATLLWILCYDFLFNYLYLKGINCKSGIALGLLFHELRHILIILSIIINLLKSKRIKIIVLITYFIYSSYFLLPDNLYRWFYFSLGSTIFIYVLEKFIFLLKIKNNLKENIFNFILLIIIYIILIFFWNDTLKYFLVFLLKYFIFGNLLIIVCAVLYYLLREKSSRSNR